MRPHHHPQIQIARRRAHRPSVPFARNPHPRAIRNAGGDAYLNPLPPPHPPLRPPGLPPRPPLPLRATRRPPAAAKIKSPKIKVDVGRSVVRARSSRPARWKVVAVEAVLVVHLPLFGIGEDIVGFLQLLEFFFRGFVAWIQIRVILPRQLAKRRTDILGARLPRHSQQFVIVLFCCRWHVCSCRGAASVPTLSGCFAPARHSR